MNILCLGGSYTGTYLARNFSRENRIFFLSRRAAELDSRGFQTIPAETLRAGRFEFEGTPIQPNLIVDCVPATKSGSEGALDPHPYEEEIKSLIKSFPKLNVVHISSTSVYPSVGVIDEESDAPVFDEDTPVDRTGKRGSARLWLEERLVTLMENTNAPRIIRAGGIYGPERSLALSFLRGDFRRASSSNRIVSRIHVHDLCRMVLALGVKEPPEILSDGNGGPILVNGVDGRASSNSETFRYLEELLKIEIPGDWRRAPAEGRRMISKYAKDFPGGVLRFPSYREGFRQILKEAGAIEL